MSFFFHIYVTLLSFKVQKELFLSKDIIHLFWIFFINFFFDARIFIVIDEDLYKSSSSVYSESAFSHSIIQIKYTPSQSSSF